MPLLDKLDQRGVDVLRMRSTQKVLPTLDGNELRIRGVGEELDFLLCIGNGIHRIFCTLVTLLDTDVTQIVADHSHVTT